MEHRLIMLVMCDFFVSTAPCVGVGKAGGLCVAGVDTLLGPQGPSMACRLVGCGWLLGSSGFGGAACVRGVAGAAGLFFENFTVDASIFVSSF